MSSNARVLDLLIVGTDEFSPTLNKLNGSLTNTARTANTQFGKTYQTMGLLGQQMYILRRSAEYMVAGFGISKVFQAISAYKSFREELGQLNSTLQVSAAGLNNLGNQALAVSSATATPLADILSSFQNIAQTYPTLPKASISKFSLYEAQAAQVLGASPQAVGSTVGALASAFYGRNKVLNPVQGPKLISQITDMLVKLQKSGLPNATGPDLLTAAQNLTGGAVIGRFTLPQALSYFAVLQRQFPSTSKSSLYLRQLMARIVTPTKAEAAYYSQAGLPTGQALAGLSGNEIIQQLLKAVISKPGSNQTYSQALQSGFKNIKIGPEGVQLLEKAIGGRLQSGIAANLLVRGFGQISPEEKNLESANAQDLSTRFNAVISQSRMTQAAIRFSNLSTATINDLNPLIQNVSLGAGEVAQLLFRGNMYAQKYMGELDRYGSSAAGGGLGAAGGLIAGSQGKRIGEAIGGFLGGHIGLEAFGTVLGVKGINRIGKLSGVSNTLSKIPGVGRFFGAATKVGEADAVSVAVDKYLGSAIRGPLDLRALSSALTGTANGTPSAPFWVVISPLSQGTVPGMFYKGKNSGTSKLADETDKLANDLKKAVTSPTGAIAETTAVIKRKSIGNVIKSLTNKSLKASDFGKYSPSIGAGDAADLGKLVPGLGAAIGAYQFLSGGNISPKAKKGNIILNSGGFTKQVPKNSFLGKMLAPRRTYETFPTAGGVPAQRIATGWASLPAAIVKAESAWLQNKLSTATLEKIIRTSEGTPTAKNGKVHMVSMPASINGQTDMTIHSKIEPSPAMQKWINAQEVKTRKSVPTRYVPSGVPAPTSRGGRATKRTR